MRALNVLLTVLVSLAIALGVLEFGFRLIPAFAPAATLNHFDAKLGWSKEPGKAITRRVGNETIHFEINEHGLRDDAGVGPGKEPNTFRVLMLGDSFVLGFTVERADLFVDQLEGWWRSEERRVDVVNAGTEGWSTDQEVAWFLENAAAYSPDLVLLFPYENDLYWNGQESYYGTPKPRFEPSGVFEAQTLAQPAKKKNLRDRSAALRALGMLAQRGTPKFNPEFGVLLDTPPAGYDDWVARTENALRNLKLACESLAKPAKLALVPLPSKSAIDPAEKQFFQSWEHGMQGETRWSPDKPVNTFLELATKLGIDAFDPRATLIAETKAKGKLYFEEEVEWHFNALGNEVLATWLHGELDRRGYFPPEHSARSKGAIPAHGHRTSGLPTWLYVFAGLWLFLGTAFCMTYPKEPKPRAYLGVGAMLGSVFLIVIGGGKLMSAELIAPHRTWIFVGLVAVILGFLVYKLGRRLGTVLELLAAFTRRGHWYLMPLVVVLLTIGSLLVVAASSPLIAPFIYTLF
jgi:hypothetical protein